jgi:DNA-directed RNA polymerase specialized sigma24 family protein
VTGPESFEQYVAARRDTLVRIAFLLTGDAHAAEDVVQVTLVRLWPRWRRLAPDGDVDAYVRRTLYTVFVSAARRRRWREVLTDPGEAASARAAVDDISL